jgi:hypothetical protein
MGCHIRQPQGLMFPQAHIDWRELGPDLTVRYGSELAGGFSATKTNSLF